MMNEDGLNWWLKGETEEKWLQSGNINHDPGSFWEIWGNENTAIHTF